jgi:hypothetical protein
LGIDQETRQIIEINRNHHKNLVKNPKFEVATVDPQYVVVEQ